MRQKRLLFIGLLLQLPLFGFSQLSTVSQKISKDSLLFQEASATYKNRHNYKIEEEIALFENIIDTLQAELEGTPNILKRKEKEEIKDFFENLKDNLIAFKEERMITDSLFLGLSTAQNNLFQAYVQQQFPSNKQYRKRKTALGLRKWYRLYEKSLVKLDSKRASMLISAEMIDKFFLSTNWNNSPFSNLLNYINHALYDLQKEKLQLVEQVTDSIEQQLYQQINALKNIAAVRSIEIEHKKNKMLEQQDQIIDLAEEVASKNENRTALEAKIQSRETTLTSIQKELRNQQVAFHKIQQEVVDFQLKARKVAEDNKRLENRSNELQITIDSVQEIGAKQVVKNQILQEKQLILEQAKTKTDNWLLRLTGVSLLGIVLLGIATNRLYQQKKQVTKSYAELEKTKDLLQLKTAELNLSHRELNHRIKNNLQQISSLIYLQEDEIEDEQARTSFSALQGRIDTIKIVHQKLYSKQQQQLTMVNMEEYVTDLVKFIVGNDAKLHLKTLNIPIEMDHATDIGLIINELVTNSSKYAFPFAAEPELWVQLTIQSDILHLLVKDNGPGFPKDFSLATCTSFGLTSIVEMFVYKSGKGTLKTFNEEGAVIQIAMPFDSALGKLIA